MDLSWHKMKDSRQIQIFTYSATTVKNVEFSFNGKGWFDYIPKQEIGTFCLCFCQTVKPR